MKIRRMDWYFDDYIGGTFGQLTFEEHGFYIVAINIIGARNDWVDLDLARLAHAGKANVRTARRLLDQLVAKGKLQVEGGQLGQRRTLSELGRSQDRIVSAHRAAAAAGASHHRRAERRKFGETFVKPQPQKRSRSARTNGLAEPRGTYQSTTIYDHDHDREISTVAAREPSPEPQASQARAPTEPERPDPPPPSPKTKARLSDLAAEARARFLKGGS